MQTWVPVFHVFLFDNVRIDTDLLVRLFSQSSTGDIASLDKCILPCLANQNNCCATLFIQRDSLRHWICYGNFTRHRNVRCEAVPCDEPASDTISKIMCARYARFAQFLPLFLPFSLFARNLVFPSRQWLCFQAIPSRLIEG